MSRLAFKLPTMFCPTAEQPFTIHDPSPCCYCLRFTVTLSLSLSLYMTRDDANSSVQFAVLSILASYKVVEIAVANPQLVGKERKPRRKWIGRLQTSPENWTSKSKVSVKKNC